MIDTTLLIESLPVLLRGAFVTLKLASLSCLIGVILGSIIGLAYSVPYTIVRWIAMFYVTIIRGTPMLIQLYIVTYLLPEIGIQLPYFWAAVVAIGLNSAAYVSQIIRLGIASVSVGQLEAATTLGFSSWQRLYYIVVPQAFKTILPALGNELVTLIKDSSLASVIGVTELTKTGANLRGVTLDVVTIFTAVGILYLTLTSLISLGVHYLEQRMLDASN